MEEIKTVNEVGYEGLKEASSEVAENEFLLADTLDEFEEDESDGRNENRQ